MLAKIFLFHRVHPERDLLWDPIKPERFDRIIKYISKKYEVLKLEDLLSDPERKCKKAKAVITFDDGYKDFIEFAHPVLKKYHCAASMFVVTDCVEKQLPPWTYVLDYHFIHSKILKLNIDFDLLPENLRVEKFNSKREHIHFAEKIKSYLKSVSDTKRRLLTEQIRKSLNDVRVPDNLLMNWEELRSILKEGYGIGSHTVSHPILSKIEEDSELLYELEESRKVINQKLGFYPNIISYPIGGYNKKVAAAAIRVGYKIGLAVDDRPYTKNDSMMEIPRIQVGSESVLKSKLRINGTLATVKRVIKG